jgi:hypothetical protein
MPSLTFGLYSVPTIHHWPLLLKATKNYYQSSTVLSHHTFANVNSFRFPCLSYPGVLCFSTATTLREYEPLHLILTNFKITLKLFSLTANEVIVLNEKVKAIEREIVGDQFTYFVDSSGLRPFSTALKDRNSDVCPHSRAC